jgi:hypothetical protein
VTVEEIIEMYEEGVLTKGETLERLADMAASGDVGRLLVSLSPVWRKDVELYIFNMYDNDVDSDDFIQFGDPDPDLDLRRRRIDALRAWIATHKVTTKADPILS